MFYVRCFFGLPFPCLFQIHSGARKTLKSNGSFRWSCLSHRRRKRRQIKVKPARRQSEWNHLRESSSPTGSDRVRQGPTGTHAQSATGCTGRKTDKDCRQNEMTWRANKSRFLWQNMESERVSPRDIHVAIMPVGLINMWLHSAWSLQSSHVHCGKDLCQVRAKEFIHRRRLRRRTHKLQSVEVLEITGSTCNFESTWVQECSRNIFKCSFVARVHDRGGWKEQRHLSSAFSHKKTSQLQSTTTVPLHSLRAPNHCDEVGKLFNMIQSWFNMSIWIQHHSFRIIQHHLGVREALSQIQLGVRNTEDIAKHSSAKKAMVKCRKTMSSLKLRRPAGRAAKIVAMQ